MNELAANIWLPKSASNMAHEVDPLFYFILWASTAIFAIVVFAIIYFCIKYRSNSVRSNLKPQISHNAKLEIFWTVIPTILIVIVFFWGARSFLRMNIWPVDSTEIHVRAKNWQFAFNYPFEDKSFSIKDTLFVPIDEPIKLVMSADQYSFIHSLFIPDFRIKQDIMANRYSQMWFIANTEGVYDYYCAEYCGAGHSTMSGKVIVMNKEDYKDWHAKRIKKQKESLTLTGVALGEYLYKEYACNTCHSTEKDKVIQAPSFHSLWGTKVEHTDGTVATVDENYITESIRMPATKIVKGFTNLMPKDYVDLPSDHVDALIEFIKSKK